MTIKEKDIYKLMFSMNQFPFPTVCRHYVMLLCCELLEMNGIKVDSKLLEAVAKSSGGDEAAETILKNILKEEHVS